MNIYTLPVDKSAHYNEGSWIFLFVYASLYVLDVRSAKHWGLAAAVAAGIAKEAADWVLNRRAAARGEPPPHGVEFWDAAMTAVGGLQFWVVLL